MQNKKKLLTLAIAGVLAIGAIGAGTLAFFTDTKSVDNVLTMGDVKIKLEEPNFAGGVNGGTISDVTPGAPIIKDPTITLEDNSNPAYVRANVKISATKAGQDFTLTGEEIEQLFAGITYDNTSWFVDDTNKATGEYVLYYKNQLTATDRVANVFDKVTIPNTWGNKFTGVSINLDVTAEAIQAENFTPVKDAGGMITSWGTVTIE